MTINIFNSDISSDTFLKDYWQQKPLLIRGAFATDFIESLISAEELAGYSLEEDIESRLISCFDHQWQLEYGPLEETRFSELPEQDWTLLVQSLDYFHPPLQELIKACNFIPRWRLDDVMVSFATNNGGVGAHIDQYDVFLIQGTGKRRWQIGHKNQTTEAINLESGISQIKPFAADLDIEVEAGDLLYIPPNTPHWGESIGESLCYSIGFRSPSIEQIGFNLLASQDKANRKILDQLWQDKHLDNQNALGKLPPEITRWSQQQFIALMQPEALQIAIGKLVTQLKYPEILDDFDYKALDSCEAHEWAELAFIKPIQLHPLARLCFFESPESALEELQVFINGEAVICHKNIKPCIEALNQYRIIELSKQFVDSKSSIRKFLSVAFLKGAIKFV